MSTLISQLPEEIRKRAELYRRWCKRDYVDQLSAAFTWDETPEGGDIWDEVDEGNYAPFYEFHNLPSIRERLESIIDRRLSRNETIDLLVKLWEERK